MRKPKLFPILFTLAAAGIFAFAQQEPAGSKVQPAGASPISERLVYKIQWDPPWYFFFLPRMDAGEASLELREESEYNGRKAYRISLTANSSGTLVRMSGMKVEDEFIYYTEPGTFCTMSASEKIREGKRRRQVNVQYLRESRQLHIREMDESTNPPKTRKNETKDNIPECVHDPLSALYRFRRLPLQNKSTQTFLLANADKIREVRSTVEKQETIETSSGKTPAWQVSTAALMGGLFKEGGQFKVWFSADEKKIPLQFEVKVRIGRVFGKLISAE